MKPLLTCNLGTKTVTDGGSAYAPPDYRFGESFTLALRFVREADGNTMLETPDIRALKAAIGLVDERPESGTFALQIGNDPGTTDNTTGALAHDCPPAAMAVAINALPLVVAAYGTAAVKKSDGSWGIIFGEGANAVPLKVVENEALPVSLGAIAKYQIDGVWRHEVRLRQAPVAFTDVGEAVLPQAPSIVRVQAGGGSGDFVWNEIQLLTVPPDFLATYSIHSTSGARTAELTVADGVEQIQAALETVLGKNFNVTAGANYSARIEFINDLAGAGQDLLTVTPLNPPPGDFTFTMALDRAELLALLVREASVTLPFEVRLQTADADEVLTWQVALSTEITINRALVWPDMATVEAIDFLRPPSPRDYVPFTSDEIIAGQLNYTRTIGDGAATEIVVDHELGTSNIANIAVRQNSAGGRILGLGTEYQADVTDDDSVTLTFASAPALNSLVVTIMTAGPVSAFLGHTHTIAQIEGLLSALDLLSDRISTLEALAPSTPPALPVTGAGPSLQILLPDRHEIFPGRFARGTNFAALFNAGAAALTKRAPALLPAVHASDVAEAPSPLGDPSAYLNTNGTPQVFINRIDLGAATVAYLSDASLVNVTAHGRAAGDIVRFTGTSLAAPLAVDTDYYVIASGLVANAFKISATNDGTAIAFSSNGSGMHAKRAAAVEVAGGYGHASFTLAPWAFVATDGRLWYAVTHAGTSTSYFPTDVERSFFTLPITPEMLRAGHALNVSFQLIVATFNATTSASVQLVIEVGTAPSQAQPATTEENLEDIVWNPTPLLTRRLLVNELLIPRAFGCTITRADDGSFTADALGDGFFTAGGQIPTDPTFVLRARLVDFDTQNSVTTARGYVAYAFTGGSAQIQ